MILLPKGSPVKERVNPARVNLPEALEKLAENKFSGYLRFDSPIGVGILIFQEGRLISALMREEESEERVIAYDAITRIFEISILGNAVLNIYRLSSDLSLSVHALLHGEYLSRGQDLKLIDIRGLLKKISSERLSGCLRVYTDERVVLIFYEAGSALGFFHDGSTELETSADVSKSVAALPEAKLDLLKIPSFEGKRMADLMASADLNPMWDKARNRLLEERRQREARSGKLSDNELEARRERLYNLLRGIAERHVGQFGVTQVDKAFKKVSPQLSHKEIDRFFEDLTRMAKLVAGPTKVREMLDEMRRNSGSLL